MSDAIIVDRRSGTSSTVAGSRQKYKKRIKEHLKDALEQAIKKRNVKNATKKGIKVKSSSSATSEPTIAHDPSAPRDGVAVGNDKYLTGDKEIDRYMDGGSGSGQASSDGEGNDEFIYHLNQDEVRDLLFEGLSLPNFVKKVSQSNTVKQLARAGFSRHGVPANLSVVRSYKESLARRVAIRASIDKQIAQEEDEEAIKILEERKKKIPFFEEVDLRYVYKDWQKKPITKAVMYCLMDVSASMDEERKNLGKWFFVLLNEFLKACYDHVEIVFVRHHTEAAIVDEKTFFYDTISGGTVVSSGLNLILNDINQNRSPERENIYLAQVSDGENWDSDCPSCVKIIKDELLNKLQFFCYLEVLGSQYNTLTEVYDEMLSKITKFKLGRAADKNDVYTIFRNFFTAEK